MFQQKNQYLIILIFTFLMPATILGESDSGAIAIGERINGYQFYRKKVVEVTRSMIFDYLKTDHIDSVEGVIKYCDSINYPDSTWMSEDERYFIYFLGIDTAHLYSTDFYSENFQLYDTTKPLELNSCRKNYDYGMNSYRFSEGIDHLELVLRKMCKARLTHNRETFPQFNDIWDFWEIIVLESCPSRETQIDSLDSFHKKYPNSPLSKLKMMNYQELIQMKNAQGQKTEIKKGRVGGGGLLGVDFSLLPNTDQCLYPDHVSFLLSIDVISDCWLFEFGVAGTMLKTQKDLVKIDTLKRGASVNTYKFSLAFGRSFSMGEQNHLSPLIGVVLHRNVIGQKELVRFDLPYLIAGKLGFNYDFIIHTIGSSLVGPTIRVAGGVLAGDFKKISSDFSYYQFYVDVTVGIFGFSKITSEID